MLKNFLLGLITIYVFIVIVFLIRYRFRIYGWFASFKPQIRLKSKKQNKIAILIPARNESKVIMDLFDSINAQTYPRELFDVHLVLDSYLDETVKLAKKVKGIIHVVENQNSKGDALDGAIKEIIASGVKYDYLTIVDADCTLDKDYLKELNNGAKNNPTVVQAKKIVKNYYLTNKKALRMPSILNGIIWTLIDDMGNRYKAEHNITQMTIGTGLMIAYPFLESLGGWPYRKTMTEDIELMHDLMEKHLDTFYYSYAKLYLEESTSLKVTNKRRTRWLTGVIDSTRIYRNSLKKSIHSDSDRENYYFVTALDLVYPFIGSSLVFSIVGLITSLILLVLQNSYLNTALVLAILPLTVIYLSFFLMTLVALIVERKNMPINLFKKILVLFIHPFFYLYYVKIAFKAFFTKGNREWERTLRIDFSFDKQEEEKENADIKNRSY